MATNHLMQADPVVLSPRSEAAPAVLEWSDQAGQVRVPVWSVVMQSFAMEREAYEPRYDEWACVLFGVAALPILEARDIISHRHSI
ncbi:hypothetical protein [Mycoplana dimorpha]|uniref:hypothetical protein n=1 Tax=Mycoplana dimorpha TaxID=28320 RepID=UPI0011B1DEDF|nr:hypothetical protein [Mycoplana dimorpha]